jgi:hypothetical protein
MGEDPRVRADDGARWQSFRYRDLVRLDFAFVHPKHMRILWLFGFQKTFKFGQDMDVLCSAGSPLRLDQAL